MTQEELLILVDHGDQHAALRHGRRAARHLARDPDSPVTHVYPPLDLPDAVTHRELARACLDPASTSKHREWHARPIDTVDVDTLRDRLDPSPTLVHDAFTMPPRPITRRPEIAHRHATHVVPAGVTF